jgi:hypothetical protein
VRHSTALPNYKLTGRVNSSLISQILTYLQEYSRPRFRGCNGDLKCHDCKTQLTITCHVTANGLITSHTHARAHRHTSTHKHAHARTRIHTRTKHTHSPVIQQHHGSCSSCNSVNVGMFIAMMSECWRATRATNHWLQRAITSIMARLSLAIMVQFGSEVNLRFSQRRLGPERTD